MPSKNRDVSASGDWLTVDRAGLEQVLARTDKRSVLTELISNSWDEDGVTQVAVTLVPDRRSRGVALLTVEDDAPAGFADLTHSYSLFAPSSKKGSATKRGRFNLGEKLVLAHCESASVVSTTGGVRFDAEGRHPTTGRRERGTLFSAVVRLSADEVRGCVETCRRLIPPPGISTTINGHEVGRREPAAEFSVSLLTEASDAAGTLRRTRRRTVVRLYEPLTDEEPHIYELGVPVVELDHGDRYHCDIGQKVPLNLERDNVTPSMVRDLRAAVLNAVASSPDLTADDLSGSWAREALGTDKVTQDTVRATVRRLYGDKAVAYDPSDRESNGKAHSEGYTVVHGGSLPKAAWTNVRDAGALLPAGQVTPSNASIELSATAQSTAVPRGEWTVEQAHVADYARRALTELLGFAPQVEVHDAPKIRADAWWGDRTLALNVACLGARWFTHPSPHAIDALLIHEAAHHYESNHLDHGYHDALCDLGARLRDVTARMSPVPVPALVAR